jgi:hypothetical protein
MDFYLSHLPGEVSEDYLKNMFGHIGSVKKIRLVPENRSHHQTLLAIISIELRMQKQHNEH